MPCKLAFFPALKEEGVLKYRRLLRSEGVSIISQQWEGSATPPVRGIVYPRVDIDNECVIPYRCRCKKEV
jgi:hypothetical protein